MIETHRIGAQVDHDKQGADERAPSFVTELGMLNHEQGQGLAGDAPVTEELCVPGTGVLRTSVLATWADVLMGILALQTILPRVPGTLDLDVHVDGWAVAGDEVHGIASVVKQGRNVIVCDTSFHMNGDDHPFAVSHATFMATGDPHARFEGAMGVSPQQQRKRLPEPFAERVGCRLVGDGIAEVPKTPSTLNAAGNLQGGLIALAVEEAARSSRPLLATTMSLRYLKPITQGPARAAARTTGSLSRVGVIDAGASDRLCVAAIVRQSPPPGS